jgi:hypothetical protein
VLTITLAEVDGSTTTDIVLAISENCRKCSRKGDVPRFHVENKLLDEDELLDDDDESEGNAIT